MKNVIDRVLELKGDNSRALFARKLGMRQQTVDNYLSGRQKPSLLFVSSVCCRCGVSADWLLGFTEDRHGHAAPVADAVSAARIAELEREVDRLRAENSGMRYALDAFAGGASRRGRARATAGDAVA